jgi:hypothetical protein
METFAVIVLISGILIGAGSVLGLAVAAFIAFIWE